VRRSRCLLGLLTAVVAGFRIEPLLYETSRLDPLVYLSAVAVILTTALVSSWVPARRARRVDPATALRSD
jgi:putative ABC transport system permease protein